MMRSLSKCNDSEMNQDILSEIDGNCIRRYAIDCPLSSRAGICDVVIDVPGSCIKHERECLIGTALKHNRPEQCSGLLGLL